MTGRKMSDVDLLKYAIDSGILSVELVKKQVAMQKREEILKKHPYKRYQGRDGKWYTYLPSENGRKKVKSSTEEKLNDKIVLFYDSIEKEMQEKNTTIHSIFEQWINKKTVNKEISTQTTERYTVDFNKYFIDVRNLPVKQFDEESTERFIDDCIVKNDMTSKQFANFRTVLYGIFKYARRKKYVDFNIVDLVTNMDVSAKRFKKNTKNPVEQVYNSNEKEMMEKYLINNLDTLNLGLLLLFKSGLRVGELAALKPEDIMDYAIYINRTEIKYKDTEKNKIVYEVRDFPKSEAGRRFVVIPNQYKWIIDKMMTNKGRNYIFEKNGKRVRTYSFRKRLRYICEAKLHMIAKSPHKVRKTYGTILLDGKARESTILQSMGHVDLACTMDHYYYNRASIEDKRIELSNIKEL